MPSPKADSLSARHQDSRRTPLSEPSSSDRNSHTSAENRRESQPQEGRRRSFFWPFLLIGLGAVLLLANLGYLPWESWALLWRLWPLLLIALGINFLIGRRSLVGAIISGVLALVLVGGAVLVLLFAPDAPALDRLGSGSEWRIEHVEYPLNGIESASMRIDWSVVPGRLSSLSDSPNLIEGDISYRGDLVFDVESQGKRVEVEVDTEPLGPWSLPPSAFSLGGQPQGRWDVRLSPEVPLELSLDVGAGDCDFDLTSLELTDLTIDGGSGGMELFLPAMGSFDMDIDGGSGTVDITLPDQIGARLDLGSGSGAFDPGSRLRLVEGERTGNSIWETENFRRSEHAIRLNIDQGSGSLSFR